MKALRFLWVVCLFLLLALVGGARPDIAESASAPQANQKGVWVRIVKVDFQLHLMDGGKILHSYPIATGKNIGDKKKVGDMRTPEGTFSVQQVQNATAWTHDFRDGKGVIAGAYGPWFIRLKTDPWKGIGIHGTHDPNSIGTRVSEGCIRMHNRDLEVLKKRVKPGMTVVIEP